MTRGERNCNPLNIRRTQDRWQGMRPVITDQQFCEFKTMEYGIRAAIIILLRYWNRNIRTVHDIITTWAPKTENPTSAYIQNVCKLAGLTEECNIPDPHTFTRRLVKLLTAMAWVESRIKLTESQIKTAWKMAMGKT